MDRSKFHPGDPAPIQWIKFKHGHNSKSIAWDFFRTCFVLYYSDNRDIRIFFVGHF